MHMLTKFKPNLALNKSKYIAAIAVKHILYLHILWNVKQHAFYSFLYFSL